MKAKAYYIAPFRGRDGDNAAPADIAHNIEIAIERAAMIQQTFAGTLDLWVPHKQIMINMAWERGWIDTQRVLWICTDLIRKWEPICIVDEWLDYTSKGMQLEIDTALEIKAPVEIIKPWDDEDKSNVASAIGEWMVRHGTLPQERDATGPLA